MTSASSTGACERVRWSAPTGDALSMTPDNDNMMADASVWLREIITPQDIYLHGADRVLLHRRTQYQELCITETKYFGRKLFLDGIVQSSEVDEFIYHESLVHPAALATDGPRAALVLGGGEGATLREVLRWPSIERVVMVDIDGELIDACKEWLPKHHQGSFDDPRVELIIGDAVGFLRDTPEKFDIVISDMTDPVEDGPSTFCFTVEFFAAIQSVLSEGGALALQAGPMSPAEIDLHAKVVRTLQEVFSDVISYSCNAAVYGRPLGFCVASDQPLLARLDAHASDAQLRSLFTPLRYLDGWVVQGLMATPRYVDASVRSKTTVYRDATPPATSGTAGIERS